MSSNKVHQTSEKEKKPKPYQIFHHYIEGGEVLFLIFASHQTNRECRWNTEC